MWEADGFAEAAGKNLVFVSLDFPRKQEAKDKVPNPKRNDELKNKYGIRGFPTVLVMTPDGEVFGKTGYRPGGAEPYIEHLEEILESGKKDLADVQKLTKALDRAEKDEDKGRAIDAIIAKLTKMSSESPFIGQLADVVSRVYPTAKGDRRKACIAALINAGRVDADLVTAAKEIDADGSKGLWVKAVVQSVQRLPQGDEEVAAYLKRITELFDAVESIPQDDAEFLCMVMSSLLLRFNDDEPGAVKWAQKGLDLIGDSEDARFRKFFEDMLDE